METLIKGSTIHSKLDDFFVTMLSEIYWAEQNLVNVLSSMAIAASENELSNAFLQHRDQTQTHIQRLEKVFSQLGISAEPVPSIGLQGLFDEGWQVIDESEEGSAQRDVALIIAAQKVEHYEISCYGSLVTLARTLRQTEVADILALTLQEEKETDSLLTIIAESHINEDASEEPAEAGH
jgi:ferritin-like metal-binding protein YciE